jgi:acyl carrier protein
VEIFEPKTLEEIRVKIAYLIEEVTFGEITPESISQDKSLIKDLGLDSLDYASVMLGCEKWVGIRVNEKAVDWREVQTVEQLAVLMYESQKK